MQLSERHWLSQQLECHAKPLGVTACDSLTHSGQFASSSSISSSSAPLPVVSPSNSFNFGFNGCLGFFGRFFTSTPYARSCWQAFSQLPTACSYLSIIVFHCTSISGNLCLPFGTLYKIVQPHTILYKVKNVKSSQGEIVGLHWSQGQSRFCTGLSHNYKVKT